MQPAPFHIFLGPPGYSVVAQAPEFVMRSDCLTIGERRVIRQARNAFCNRPRAYARLLADILQADDPDYRLGASSGECPEFAPLFRAARAAVRQDRIETYMDLDAQESDGSESSEQTYSDTSSDSMEQTSPDHHQTSSNDEPIYLFFCARGYINFLKK